MIAGHGHEEGSGNRCSGAISGQQEDCGFLMLTELLSQLYKALCILSLLPSPLF